MSECPHCHKAISIRIFSGNDEEGLPANEKQEDKLPFAGSEGKQGQCKFCGAGIYWQYSKKKAKWYRTNSTDVRDFHHCES